VGGLYAKMFHVKHRGAGGFGERRWRKWFHVKHRAALRGLGPESFYAEMFHVKHRATGGVGSRKHEKRKTTPCIKNRPDISMA
jgi:hypothetical protein